MAKVPAKKASRPAPAKKTVSREDMIVKACEMALAKLVELNMDHQLQSEINWCLGSYHNDHNPIGLYQMADRAVALFKEARAAKIKGIPPKLITDIEAALAQR